MINILKNPVICALLLWQCTLTTAAQIVEIQAPGGKLQFQLIENQKSITNYLVTALQQGNDSVSLLHAVPGYMVSVVSDIAPLDIPDSIELKPTGPHYRGVLTVPIYISPQGKRMLQFDRMVLVHGKNYGHSDVKSMQVTFYDDLKKHLFLRLCDTVIKQQYTPLPDTLQDRYGRVDRKKLRAAMNPMLNSLTTHFAHPALTAEEMMEYEIQGGLPAMDGKYLVIGTLHSEVEVLNINVNELVNNPTRAAWKIITR